MKRTTDFKTGEGISQGLAQVLVGIGMIFEAFAACVDPDADAPVAEGKWVDGEPDKAAPEAPSPEVAEEKSNAVPKKASRRTTKKAAPAPAEEKAPEPEPEPAPVAEDAPKMGHDDAVSVVKKMDYDDVVSVVTKVITTGKARGIDYTAAVSDAVRGFGVQKISEVPPERYAELTEAILSVMGEA